MSTPADRVDAALAVLVGQDVDDIITLVDRLRDRVQRERERNAELLAALKRALEPEGNLQGATRRGDIRAAIARAEGTS